jgi:hypothetical protein
MWNLVSPAKTLHPQRDFNYLARDTAYIPKAFGMGFRSALLERRSNRNQSKIRTGSRSKGDLK